jgi:hypothetical protein
VNDTIATTRLAAQFRKDVRAARDAKADNPSALMLTLDDELAIDYQMNQAQLLRVERHGKEFRRREAYSLAQLGPPEFTVDGPQVRLVLSRNSGTGAAGARPPVRIEARLGKDRQLANLAEVGK